MVGRTNTSFSAGGAGTMTLNTNINVNTGGGDKKKGSVYTIGGLSRTKRIKGGNNYLFKKLIGSQETNAQPTLNPPTFNQPTNNQQTDTIVSTVNSNPINGDDLLPTF